MSNAEERSCYDCRNFRLCRLRDKACDLKDYFNQTGNLMGSEFATKLYELMGTRCSEFGELERDD